MLLKDMKKINDGWKFVHDDCRDNEYARADHDDTEWSEVTLPHDWDTDFAPEKDNKSGAGGGYAKAGIGWYRRKLTVTESDLLTRTELIFEGVYMECEVFVNGQAVGGHDYGYSTFVLDISDDLVFGDNLIAVRVNNSKQPNSRWYTGSGIYRDVYIRKTEGICLDYFGSKVDTSGIYEDGKYAALDIKSVVQNYTEDNKDVVVKWILEDEKGATVTGVGASHKVESMCEAEAATRMFVDNPVLWSEKEPYLYKLITKVFEGESLVDEREEFIGIRTAEFHKDNGFLLNGVRTKIKGVCLHHDSGLFGAAFHKEIWEDRLKLLKDMGVNGIRCSHNPPAPALLDLCDSLGFIVMDELCDEWTLGKNKNENYYSDQPSYGFSQFFYQDAENELRTLVRRDYNHPSVVLWSIGNEIPEQSASDGAKIVEFLSEIVHEEDPIRLVTSACDNIASLPGASTTESFMDALDVVGYNYVGRWRERAERFYEDDKRLHPDRLMIGTENPSVCGDRGDYSLDKKYNDNYVTAALTHEALWRFTASRDYVAGDYIWTGIDYLGEAHWPRRGANFGPIDTAGLKKDAFYYFRSIWNQEDVTLHLLPHWNFEGNEGEFKQVLCYTNCERVKLFINDRLISEKASAACPRYGATKSWDDEARRYHPTTGDLHLSWDVPYEKGVLRAEGYIGDKLVKSCEVETTGPVSNLSITKKSLGEFYVFEVDAVDDNGKTVPDDNGEVVVSFDKALEFVGMDAGNMLDLSAYKSEKRAMLAGKLVAVFKKKDKEAEAKIVFRTGNVEKVVEV